MKIVSFTGHRPQKLGGFNQNNPIMTRVRNELFLTINDLIKEGVDTFISGGALGVDQLVCEIILSLKKNNNNIKLIIARPFPSQSKVWSFDQKKIFEKYLKSADKVVDVSSDPYSPYKMQIRNEWMIKNSDILVAVWDGSPSGTKNAIDFAVKQGKKIIYLKV